MTDLSHLEEHEADAPEASTLETLMERSEELIRKREEHAELNAKLKEKKKEVTKLEQETLPQIMLALGLEQIKLKTGQMLSIKEDVSCSVKNYDKLYAFLEDQGDDALMKTSIELDKLPKNILERVLKDLKKTYDIDGTAKLYIHPQTLNAYFRRLCAIGTDDQARVPLAQIDDEMVSAYTFYKIGVKK